MPTGISLTRIRVARIMTVCLGLGVAWPAEATTIGVSISHFDENFLTIVSNGIASEAKAKGVSVQFEDAQGDVGRQISQVQNFISQHADAIIVNAVDSGESRKLNALAVKAKIPLV